MKRILAAVFVVALAALALPSFAAAGASFTVNSIGDGAKEPAGAVCETSTAGECTLRAAIQAANVDSEADVILFDQNLFSGSSVGNEIEPATALPTIVQPLQILGNEEVGTSRCGSLTGIPKPCQGIKAPTGSAALTVESDDVTITGLAIGGGQYGISVLGESKGLVAQGNWIGFHLSAVEDPIERDGILLTAGSDGALVGGTTVDQRNVIGFSAVGVYVEGASETKIRGNYLGVSALGRGDSDLSTAIRIVDVEGIPVRHAEDNEVGAVLASGEASTAACDGGCNVIAADSRGVDLTGRSTESGKLPATGPTRVRGNYFGLSADGTEEVPEAEFGVFAGGAEGGLGSGPSKVTVGGLVSTEANYIEGGEYSIYAERAEGFSARGNQVGVQPDESDGIPPDTAAIRLDGGDGLVEKSEVSENRMRLGFDQRGVETLFGGATIVDNEITKAEIGVFAVGSDAGHGNLIEANQIFEPDTRGIRIDNDENVVVGNTIADAGRAGVQLRNGADGNQIGGDSPEEENLIFGSGEHEGAIEVEGTEEMRNEIRANRGSLNSGAFISLFGSGVGEIPNGGVEPPTLGSVDRASAEGTAEPGATVRVFRKASNDPGEIESFLGKATADGSGHWQLTYSAISGEGFVAATQTKQGGTSELTTPTKLPAEPGPPAPPSGGGGGGGNPPVQGCPLSSVACPGGPANPPRAPQVKITKKPQPKSAATTAKFKFTAVPAAGSKFECKLDKGKFGKCKSPKTYKKLKVGRHTFRVRAVGSTGLKSKPATYKFTVTE